MKFPTLSHEQRIAHLQPPSGKIRVVIDSDTYNEVDDQFAIAYALLSPERMDVEAVYAAPYSSTFFAEILETDHVDIPMTSDLQEGLELSYQEIHKIYEKLNMPSEGKVFRGSNSYLKDSHTPVESEAARDLVKRAMESDELLYVVAIGEITNIASAILMEPEIIKKIVVVWLGGHPLYWPQAFEFNLGQDVLASQLIFDSGVPLYLVPCMTVASHLTTTAAELREAIYGKSVIGTYLADTVISQLGQEPACAFLNTLRFTYLKGLDDYPQELIDSLPITNMACSRIIWDISTVGYLINPNWCPSTLVPTPRLTSDMKWEIDDSRPVMRLCHYVQRDGIFGDMFDKLAKADD